MNFVFQGNIILGEDDGGIKFFAQELTRIQIQIMVGNRRWKKYSAAVMTTSMKMMMRTSTQSAAEDSEEDAIEGEVPPSNIRRC